MHSLPHLPRAKAVLVSELLQRKRTRAREESFVLEGARPILEVLQKKSIHVRFVVLTPSFFQSQVPDIKEVILRSYCPAYQVSEMHFDRLTSVETTQGILAVMQKPVWEERHVLAQPRIFGLVGEQLQDPGNVGTIIRTAAAFRVTALWLTPDSADIFSPKIVRATAGSLLNLPIFHCPTPEIFARQGCSIIAADSSNRETVSISHVEKISGRTILAVGNESRGLSKATLEMATLRVHIPLDGEVESLNVAMAAGILIFSLRGLPLQ